jgi:glycosyltransferase involved in cell wall biosynthesis
LKLTPLVTIAVPSFNQGEFLDETLSSIFDQDLPVEVFVMDGGSQDDSVAVIKRWQSRLSGWRSEPDCGQAAAINEGVALGTAPYVCWLNSDDRFLPGGLARLVQELERDQSAPVAYGGAVNDSSFRMARRQVWVEPFSLQRLAVRCFISQPATLVRRSCWEAVGGVDTSLDLAFDYDLWWRLALKFGPFAHVDELIAANRDHAATKTRTRRWQHYAEAIRVVRKHNGRVPAKWWGYWPYSVLLGPALARIVG